MQIVPYRDILMYFKDSQRSILSDVFLTTVAGLPLLLITKVKTWKIHGAQSDIL